MKDSNKRLSCCKKESGVLSGMAYGLIPHVGCIAFIVFTILGVTAATAFFKPLLLNPYFFYIFIVLSFVFATISATIYLKKNEILSIQGVKRKWKYLSTLYSTTIGVNLLLFIIIFPLLANVSAKSTSITENFNSISSIKLGVAIPCPGHAPLITDKLKKIDGILEVQFSFPNIFDVKYDSTKTSKEQILSLEVFKTYNANVLWETTQQVSQQQYNTKLNDNIGGCCATGSCSGRCGCELR